MQKLRNTPDIVFTHSKFFINCDLKKAFDTYQLQYVENVVLRETSAKAKGMHAAFTALNKYDKALLQFSVPCALPPPPMLLRRYS